MSMLVPFYFDTPSTIKNQHDKSVMPVYDPFKSLFSDDVWNDSAMKCDVKETDTDYEIKADMPGAAKEDISVTYDDDILDISYKHDASNDKKDENGKYIMQERSYSEMERQFRIPDGDKENVHAKLDNGVLTITVPKNKETKPEENKVTVE